MSRTWTTATPRKTSRKLRAAVFLRQDGVCACCPTKLHLKRWILDHITPLEEGGADDESNLQAICEPCSTVKTSKEATERADYRSTRDRFIGAKTSRHPMPCGRASRVKRKMDGTLVDRATGEPIR